jgi:hypothetical protein
MGTTTTRRRNPSSASNVSVAAHGLNAGVFSALCASYEMITYGSGKPLYELVVAFGEVTPLNTLDTALQSFDEMREGLKEGDAAFAYSDQYDRFSLAMKMQNGGIGFASLLHDGNGTPRVDEPLQLCLVRAIKDFEWEGETIIQKGQQFVKALPQSYLGKLEKAA